MSKQKDRPDREKLREKIANAISECDFESVGYDGLAQHILNRVPIEPLIEEAIQKERRRILDYERKSIPAIRREAKREERERVMGILQKEYPAIDTWQCWQALKED